MCSRCKLLCWKGKLITKIYDTRLSGVIYFYRRGRKKEMYSLSRYNYSFKENGKRILFNTYSQALVELDEEEYGRLINLDVKSSYKDDFIRLGYWVDYDEREEILRRNEEKVSDKKTLQLVIRMTDACNFRCPYCYQEHESVFLDKEKRDILKKFIDKKIVGVQKLYVHYFGGEPLLNIDGILEMDAYIKKYSVEYEASLTTNGYLLNEEILQKLKQTNICRFQITLDGPRETHNKSRILCDGSGSFDIILKNIKNILEMTKADIKIRFNCGKKNRPYVEELLEILYNENILGDNRVNILYQQLHNYSGVEDNETYYDGKEYFSVLIELMRLLIKYRKPVYKFGPLYKACTLYVENAYVIGPDLEIEICTTEECGIGKIDRDGIPQYNKEIERKMMYAVPDHNCMDCILLPMCMGGCPYKRSRNMDSCLMKIEDLQPYVLLRLEQLKGGLLK